MSKKLLWQDIYKDFRRRHPNLKKMAIDWKPYGYCTIIVYFKDGYKAIYDYMLQMCTSFYKD